MCVLFFTPGDDPTDGTSVQLNLFICSPFGEYELELDIKSENDAGTTNKRVSWEVENGPDEVNFVNMSKK